MTVTKEIKEIENLIGEKLDDIKEGWSKADQELQEFVFSSTTEDYALLWTPLIDAWNNDVATSEFLEKTEDKFDGSMSEAEKLVGSVLFVHELREYAGHTLNIFSEKPNYTKTLTRVHKRIAKSKKKKARDAASVRYREENITKLIFEEAINDLTDNEINEALEGIEFDPELVSASKRKLLLQTLAAGGFSALTKILGKRIIKEIVLGLINAYAIKMIGKKAAEQLLKKLAAKLPQYLFKRANLAIAVGFLVKDAIDLGGEATRITTPLVVNISILRTLERAKNDVTE